MEFLVYYRYSLISIISKQFLLFLRETLRFATTGEREREGAKKGKKGGGGRERDRGREGGGRILSATASAGPELLGADIYKTRALTRNHTWKRRSRATRGRKEGRKERTQTERGRGEFIIFWAFVSCGRQKELILCVVRDGGRWCCARRRQRWRREG